MKEKSLWGHFVDCVSRNADYRARATRREYLGFQIFYTIFFLLYLVCLWITFLEIAKNFDASDLPPVEESIASTLAWILVILYLIFSPIFLFVSAFASIAVTIRRLHDRGISGKVVVGHVLLAIPTIVTTLNLDNRDVAFTILFITLAYYAWIVVQCLLPGDEGDNEYGPDPRVIQQEEAELKQQETTN